MDLTVLLGAEGGALWKHLEVWSENAQSLARTGVWGDRQTTETCEVSEKVKAPSGSFMCYFELKVCGCRSTRHQQH